MNKIEKKIIAIGGGGFTHQIDKSLDQFVIDQSKKINNKIGFLATASNDDKKKIDLFYERFENTEAELSHFNLTSDVNGFSEWILNKDIIYIGGGNTANMLEIWKNNKLENIFKEAYEDGIILSGVIAGFVLWIIEWPVGANIQSAADLEPQVLINMAIFYGPVVAALGFISVLFYFGYKLTP